MKTSARTLWIGCSTAMLLVTGAAQAQEACKSYVVVHGDHLRGIARRAYNDPDLYRLIYDANRDIIGVKADLILPGTALAIPCAPGNTESQDVAAAEPEAEALATEIVDPATEVLSTEVIDPAKEPLVILPEIPVVGPDEVATAEPEAMATDATTTAPEDQPAADEPMTETAEAVPAEEPVAETAEAVPAEEPVAETAEAAPAEEPAAEPAEAAPAEEPATETVEAAPVEEPATETTEVAAAPAEEPEAETATAEAVAPAEPAPEAEPVAVAEATTAEQPAVDVAASAETTQTAVAPASSTAAAPNDSPIKILTGNGYAPFSDEMLPGGGMFTQIVEMAVFRADPNLPYSLTYINDWQAHIDALLPSQAYDLSFPWIRPNCEAPETLTTGDLARCNDFVFSAPYYEVVDGYFALNDSDLLVTDDYKDFLGKLICRPEAFTTGMLEAQGLTPDTVILSRPAEAVDCFEALSKGEVDLVAIDTAIGDSIVRKLKLSDKIGQNPNLTTVTSLHVIAHKSNARAVSMLAVLDQGLMEMNQSGEWWDIISDALGKQ